MTNELKNQLTDELEQIPPMADCVGRVVALGARRRRHRAYAVSVAAAAACVSAGLVLPTLTTLDDSGTATTNDVAAQGDGSIQPTVAPLPSPGRRNIAVEKGLVLAIEATFPTADRLLLVRAVEATFGSVVFTLDGRQYTVHGYVHGDRGLDAITCASIAAESCASRSTGGWSFSAAVQTDDSGVESAVIYGSSRERTSEMTVTTSDGQVPVGVDQLLDLAAFPELVAALEAADTTLSPPAGLVTPTAPSSN